MRWYTGACILILLVAIQTRAEEKVERVVVPGVHAYAGVPKGTAPVISDLILEALFNRHSVRALGPSDVRAMLDAEQQKILVGCDNEKCMTELAGALGADWLVAGTLGKLDDLYVINLQIIDARQAKVISRASGTVKQISKAIQSIGPLVDQLLKKQPKTVGSIQAFEQLKPSKHVPWTSKVFCKRLYSYQSQLENEAYKADMHVLRRLLLLDLALTKFERQYKQKRACYFQDEPKTTSDLKKKLKLAKDETQAVDIKLRIAEWYSFYEQIKWVDEAYQKGIKHNQPLSALPFEVARIKMDVPSSDPQMQRYMEKYLEACIVVQDALDASDKQDQNIFNGLFFETKAATRGWKELNQRKKQGYSYLLSPVYTIMQSDLNLGAKDLERLQQVRCHLLRQKDDNISSKMIRLKKQGANWKIKSW
jgi:hypothetical protein